MPPARNSHRTRQQLITGECFAEPQDLPTDATDAVSLTDSISDEIKNDYEVSNSDEHFNKRVGIHCDALKRLCDYFGFEHTLTLRLVFTRYRPRLKDDLVWVALDLLCDGTCLD